MVIEAIKQAYFHIKPVSSAHDKVTMQCIMHGGEHGRQSKLLPPQTSGLVIVIYRGQIVVCIAVYA